MNQDSTIVALFVRAPVPGRVKTRLATDLGNEMACNFYLAMVADIISNIRLSGFPIYLFYDQGNVEKLPEDWVTASSKVVPQSGDSIGERMAAAFEFCFADDIQQVILVGSDIPDLDSSVMMSAAKSLMSHDIAISPAFDGGYCLIAIKRETYRPRIFENVPWSSAQVLRTTLERCAECELDVELLDTLQDIDTIDDLKVYCRNVSDNAILTNFRIISEGYMTKQ